MIVYLKWFYIQILYWLFLHIIHFIVELLLIFLGQIILNIFLGLYIYFLAWWRIIFLTIRPICFRSIPETLILSVLVKNYGVCIKLSKWLLIDWDYLFLAFNFENSLSGIFFIFCLSYFLFFILNLLRLIFILIWLMRHNLMNFVLRTCILQFIFTAFSFFQIFTFLSVGQPFIVNIFTEFVMSLLFILINTTIQNLNVWNWKSNFLLFLSRTDNFGIFCILNLSICFLNFIITHVLIFTFIFKFFLSYVFCIVSANYI